MKTLLTLISVTLYSIAFSQNVQTFEKDNIKFEYPENWIKRDFPDFYILVSEPPKEKLSVMTTFDVAIDKNYKKLNKFCEYYELKMKNHETFKEFEIVSKTDIDFKGMTAIGYHCKATAAYIPMEWKSIVFVKDKKVYKLSATSMIGIFYLNKALIDGIYNSFEIN